MGGDVSVSEETLSDDASSDCTQDPSVSRLYPLREAFKTFFNKINILTTPVFNE